MTKAFTTASSKHRVANTSLRRRKYLHKSVKFLPGHGAFLTSAIHPLEEDAYSPAKKVSHGPAVESDSIVLDVTPQLCAEREPEFFHPTRVAVLLAPVFYPLQFAVIALAAGLQLGNDGSGFGLSQKESEAEKIKTLLTDSPPPSRF